MAANPFSQSAMALAAVAAAGGFNSGTGHNIQANSFTPAASSNTSTPQLHLHFDFVSHSDNPAVGAAWVQSWTQLLMPMLAGAGFGPLGQVQNTFGTQARAGDVQTPPALAGDADHTNAAIADGASATTPVALAPEVPNGPAAVGEETLPDPDAGNVAANSPLRKKRPRKQPRPRKKDPKSSLATTSKANRRRRMRNQQPMMSCYTRRRRRTSLGSSNRKARLSLLKFCADAKKREMGKQPANPQHRGTESDPASRCAPSTSGMPAAAPNSKRTSVAAVVARM